MRVHPIPDAALDDRLGFVGTAGSGKTYNASACVERLLDTNARVVVVDPLDVWWGLRLIADGSGSSRYSMPIFGGAHGDLPLTEHAGALIGETVAGMAESCIVSLGGLQTKASERRFMLAFLDAIYRKANGEPVHIIFDEADLWAPQKTSEPMLQSRMEEICRRGRIKGLIPWLITQRPAVISKDVLSQVDGLVAFKLTSSQDRDALEGWIEGQADRAQWKEIRAALPTMERGQGVIWLPGRGVLDTVKFPAKRTFDSSRTPKRGEAKRTAALKPLDLGALKSRLASIETETKASDPKALKAKIADLEKQLAAKPAASRPTERIVEVTDDKAIAAAQRSGYDQAVRDSASWHAPELVKIGDGIKALLNTHLDAMPGAIRAIGKQIDSQVANLNKQWHRGHPNTAPLPESLKRLVSGPPPANPAGDAPRAKVHPDAHAPRATPSPVAGSDGTLPTPLQKIMDAISWWKALGIDAPNYPQVAFRGGYSPGGGTFKRYLSDLRGRDLIRTSDSRIEATDAGLAIAKTYDRPSPETLRADVLNQIERPLAKLLSPLINEYPDELALDDLGARSEYAASGGTFKRYLSSLRSLELVEEPARGQVRASEWLFP